MPRSRRCLFAVVLLAGLARQAAADPVCLSIDEQRDMLSPEERRGAIVALGGALAKNDVEVVAAGCTASLVLFDVRLGESITAYLATPRGTISGRVSKIDELPLLYDQLAHAYVTGTPMGEQNVDRTNVTSDQAAPPRRIVADAAVYFRLGYGAVTGNVHSEDPALGLGLRRELDHFAIDVSLLNAVAWTSYDFIRLGGMWFQAPEASESLYLGMGIGFGGTFLDGQDKTGLDGTLVLGYEILRASTLRVFVEAAATLPFYRVPVTGADGSLGAQWSPAFSLALGMGFGR
ncbi:MAG TPA: hypothetical protein VL119_10395 [Acidimicrobiia bacterium]|nr:hypothetical protein [Acidimicrobiia bacterium]